MLFFNITDIFWIFQLAFTEVFIDIDINQDIDIDINIDIDFYIDIDIYKYDYGCI